MLHLIEKLLPAPLHRALLPLVFRIRHRWRKWRKVNLRGCAVIVCNPGGEILLLRHSYGPDVWALPGGGIDSGEDPAHAALREVREELGIALDSVELVAQIAEEVSSSPHTAYLFTAVTADQPVPDQREVIEARFFAPDALPQPIGRVTAKRLSLWHEHAGNGSGISSGHSSES